MRRAFGEEGMVQKQTKLITLGCAFVGGGGGVKGGACLYACYAAWGDMIGVLAIRPCVA